jgi:oligopeptide/dipeptide ABC transporter ATP-binding protein
VIEPVLELDHVTRWYPVGGSLSRSRRWVQAVTDVSFAIDKGETVGLIGESGCGKSTLARTIVGLEPLTSGTVKLTGEVVSGLGDRERRTHRRHVQIVWQNAASAVNRRMRVGKIIREPLDIHQIGTRPQREARVRELLEMVALRPELVRRYPHELSGGQLQRVGVARALALEPKLLICDEPTASLDVSVRAQIVNLLCDLRDDLGLTLLYISHDLSTVRTLCSRILIMYLGRVVEEIPGTSLDTAELLHPYAKALVSAIPVPDPNERRGAPDALGEVPSAIKPPSGCAYHPRCRLAKALCREESASLTETGLHRRVACHAVNGPLHERWLADQQQIGYAIGSAT